jgi:hypothetical protein
MINIISSFFIPENNERKEELIFALKKNCESEFVKRVHLFVDDQKAYDLIKSLSKTNPKINLIEIKNPYYSDLFSYANKLENEICFVVNNDIYLDNINNIKVLNLLKDDCVFALTRHEHDMSCPLIDNYEGSHDGFMFKAPIKKIKENNIFLKKKLMSVFLTPKVGKDVKEENKDKFQKMAEDVANTGLFYQFYLGSENVIVSVLHFLHLKILNPCKNIILIHNHKKDMFYENGKYIESTIRINNPQFLKKINPVIIS